MTISGLVLVAINISSKSCTEKTHTCVEQVFWKSCRGKSVTAGQDTDDNMARARYMLDNKGFKHTHTKYVTLIALPLQQRLHELAPVLRYTYSTVSVCLSGCSLRDTECLFGGEGVQCLSNEVPVLKEMRTAALCQLMSTAVRDTQTMTWPKIIKMFSSHKHIL